MSERTPKSLPCTLYRVYTILRFNLVERVRFMVISRVRVWKVKTGYDEPRVKPLTSGDKETKCILVRGASALTCVLVREEHTYGRRRRLLVSFLRVIFSKYNRAKAVRIFIDKTTIYRGTSTVHKRYYLPAEQSSGPNVFFFFFQSTGRRHTVEPSNFTFSLDGQSSLTSFRTRHVT